MVDIWNSLPGATPVKKFKDRATAVSRIWKALHTLDQAAPAAEETMVSGQEVGETAQPEAGLPETAEPAAASHVAPQTPEVTPHAPSAKTNTTRAVKAPKAANAGLPREGSKTSRVIAMLKQDGGATLEEISKTMGWELHTTRHPQLRSSFTVLAYRLIKIYGFVRTNQLSRQKTIYCQAR